MTHPYSIYIFLAASGSAPTCWTEPLQAASQEHAVYAANLIHKDSKSVIKVVRYGHNLLWLPDGHTVELCERQITKQQDQEVEQPFSID